MKSRSIFQNISPLDSRYSLSNSHSEEAVFESLVKYLSEDAACAAAGKAEAALVKAHLAVRGKLSPQIEAALDAAAASLTPEAVYAEEAKTRHFLRALVNVYKAKLSETGLAWASHYVHLGATSVDILDTALAWRMKGVSLEVVTPLLRKLLDALCEKAWNEAASPQTGRTHGQHAVPVTAGFAFAEYVSRLGKCIGEIENRAADLRGKLSGACGAYNAMSLLVSNPEELENRYLAYLGLSAGEHSTQLVEPEYLLRLLLEYNVAFGVIANLADDLRNLQRSEIAECAENFEAESQVGSSTMPQKRNPWNSEHVKSLWKAFSPRVLTFFMDQISEHQRDLTNSASQRFIADYAAGFCLAVSRMTAVVTHLYVDRERMLENLRSGGGGLRGGVLAEAAYILLAETGESDAHELVRRVTVEAEKTGKDFYTALQNAPFYSKIAQKMPKLENYTGLAEKKARELARKYGKRG